MGLSWQEGKTKITHLLNTSTGTEADIRVDLTLHLAVVVAVCLRERKQKKHWVFKIQSRKWEQRVGLSAAQQHHFQMITVKYELINSGGIVFCRVSNTRFQSSPQANDGSNRCRVSHFPSQTSSWWLHSQVPAACQAATGSKESELSPCLLNQAWQREGGEEMSGLEWKQPFCYN